MSTPRQTHCATWFLALALATVVSSWAADTFDSIYISELLVENRPGDAAKHRRDRGWIELHNAGPGAVNLADWYLSDVPTNLTKWRFPRVVMLPDSYLV